MGFNSGFKVLMAIYRISKHSVLELVNNAGNLFYPVTLFFYIFRYSVTIPVKKKNISNENCVPRQTNVIQFVY